jgi:acetylornithine deacetylase/succinyl-diaminopimelate desuccinylase-like protein
MSPVKSNSLFAQLLKNDRVCQALAFFGENAERITAQQVEICSIPSPSFGESKRAEFLKQKFIELDLTNARIDREGNVLALREGRDQHPLLVVSAHLDTVFPENTDLSPKFENGKIFQPGIMDDGCGLVALLALAEALQKISIKTDGSILFVGTVGEEGAGNLRGVRHLLTNGEYAPLVSAFVSLDGAGVDQIVHRALASKRYEVQLRGVGGHSWLDFGAPNPVHALGRVVAKLTAFPRHQTLRTSFNVGKLAGGTSVNAISTEAVLEVDLRSESSEELLRLDTYFRRSVFEAVAEEDAARKQSYPSLEFDLKTAGERPGGETSANSELVRLAIEATKALGISPPQLTISSTDSNFAMSIDLPAITIGAGGVGDKMHTLSEWYDPTNRETGLQRALLLVIAFVGLHSHS